MPFDPTDSTRRSYDAVAAAYARHLYDELAGKPFDREMLQSFADERDGLVVDMGSGPGQVGRFLAECGADVCALDLSAAMAREGRRLDPGRDFVCADMRRLPLRNHTLDGIVAFYSIIHVEPREREATFREWLRVLKPGGAVLVSYHIGEEVLHLDEWWDERVDVDFHFLQTADVLRDLEAAGFTQVQAREREPYDEAVEHQSRRGYVTARAPKERLPG